MVLVPVWSPYTVCQTSIWLPSINHFRSLEQQCGLHDNPYLTSYPATMHSPRSTVGSLRSAHFKCSAVTETLTEAVRLVFKREWFPSSCQTLTKTKRENRKQRGALALSLCVQRELMQAISIKQKSGGG